MRFALAVAAAVVAIALIGSIVSSNVSASRTSSSASLTYDFGEAVAGVTVEHSFEIRNNTDGMWTVQKVRGSCNCLTASVPERDVPPGEYLKVSCVLDTRLLDGPQNRLFEIVFTDSPPLRGRLVGTVVAALRVDGPRRVHVSGPDRTFEAEYSVRYPVSFEPALLVVSEVPLSRVEVAPGAPEQPEPGEAVLRRFVLRGDAAEVHDRMRLPITVRLVDENGELAASYGLELTVVVERAFTVNPKILAVPALSEAQELRLDVTTDAAMADGRSWQETFEVSPRGPAGQFSDVVWTAAPANPHAAVLTLRATDATGVILRLGGDEVVVPVLQLDGTGLK